MTRRLIVNADDYGICEPVNLGIIKGHREGIITSTTILAGGASAEHAAELARNNPGLGVGVHLCLVLERPVLDPCIIPSITEGGKLYGSSFHFMRRLVVGLVRLSEVEAELRAQIERTIALGIRPTHLDGHQHMHAMPGVLGVVVKLATEFGIPAVRYPVGPWTNKPGAARVAEKVILESIAWSGKGKIDSAGIRHTASFFGLAETGRLSTEALLDILEKLPEGTSELMCHPGLRDDTLAREINWGYGWETELSAVTDARALQYVRDNGIELVSYAGL